MLDGWIMDMDVGIVRVGHGICPCPGDAGVMTAVKVQVESM